MKRDAKVSARRMAEMEDLPFQHVLQHMVRVYLSFF
jgi:hypothetical protein